ncbi:glycosyltransferase family 1 protein [Aquitalea palustris]|uniref:Glycosyltransferase family 1 protein n=1 Tax=Aquitalea palustris TaxID=2480983 RepID=A0A454JLQ3_9NEIS|nr:glycosyltransferase family 4 protein [Aquitalea palustris]RMD00818.1 glycosyltransferase family 1 protein [Aquitalea palustris]
MSEWVLFTESSPNVGGQELQLMQQMRQMQQRGLRTMLACRPGSRVEEVALQQGLSVLPVRFRNSLHLPSIAILRRWISQHKPRLAICHSGHDSNNLAIAARLVWRRPFLLRSRTYQPGRPGAWSYNRMVDATMVPSQYLKDALLANPAIRADRVHVVYPGIDFIGLDRAVSQPLPASVASWLISGRGPVLLHAAMLRGEKGHLTILQAMDLLRQSHPNWRYLIAGEGVAQQQIETEVRRLGLEARVLLAGVVSPVAPLYQAADLVLMPSTYEPLGMSQIEALALARPVLASRTGGIPETVHDGQTGVLVEPGNCHAWAQAIASALDNLPQQQTLACAGRADVRQRFDPGSNLNRILALSGLADQLPAVL